MSTYTHHSADEIAAMTKPQRAAHDAERRAFDREVADLVAAARRQGWIDVGTAGKAARINLPIALTHSHGAVYRDTVGLGLRGAL